jgi:hypothetical protein
VKGPMSTDAQLPEVMLQATGMDVNNIHACMSQAVSRPSHRLKEGK